ncbi:unnamed protein product [Rotaria magnacalcarata]|uniref:Cytokinin riboside 5'-monophosphate phosphoribohydrolase n=1 Tax=Rotaria magnacalcarata TaxID=392030 RepID=A0A816S0U8_9BILA|nr:unnamed protein product [Rotaria magnacalcarata]CAF1259694.1 unnamed protein product [Rotaria magnacalcarata]CAF1920577.1 unnamed protein product [Rotaria magnacalcarata]CAF2076312.1 unnamed protein product [Rotaria magnacalcarata]CAF3933351.1 unnamed protein product [Rotaria magnacalcarata]
MTSKRICVYCASSDICDRKFLDAGRQLGEALALMNVTVVYGGAQCGVMGALADGALSAKGKVIGWIPTFMKSEALHPGLTEVHEVETMHIRKHGMMMNSDGLIALPGGTGTLEELMEAITWKRLDLIHMPIFIVNLDGFYDPLLDLFENMFNERFISRDLQKHWVVVKTIDEIIEQLKLML